MASVAQQLAFLTNWIGAAESASKQLHIPAVYILGQWAMESGWGTQPNMGQNNPGNVGNLGGGGWQNYSSQSSFVSAYVAAMQNDFPYFQHPVTNPTIADIFGGRQRYDPGNPNYNQNVTNGAQAVVSVLGTSQLGQQLALFDRNGNGQIPVLGITNVTTPVVSGIFGALTGWVGTLLWGLVAIVLFIVGILLLLNADPADALKLANPISAAKSVVS